MRLLATVCLALSMGSALAAPAPAPAGQELPLGQELPAPETMADPTPWLLAKVTATDDVDYYGTATLVGLDDAHYFFLTNAHVLQSDRTAWGRLRFTSPLKNYHATPVEVVGVTYGYDLAVVALPRDGDDLASAQTLETLVGKIFFEGDASQLVQQIAITGFPGYPSLNGRIIPAERSDFLDDDLRAARGEEKWPARSWSYPIAVAADGDCPPPFLQRCYHVPIVSWGFSGGVLMGLTAEPAAWPRPKILGVVSHFEPLTDQTHVIPAGEALKVARRLIAGWRGEPQVETDDERGLLRAEGPGAVKVLGGSLEGLEIVPAGPGSVAGGHESVGGGHESVGGGHESVGGGHESVGGGHESVGGGHESVGGGSDAAALYSTTSGNVAFLGHWTDLLAAMKTPTTWERPGDAFGGTLALLKPVRGVLATLRYRPGVEARTGDAPGPLHQSYDGHVIPGLQDFVQRYLHDPAASWTPAPAADAAPTSLSLPATRRRGHHSFAFLGRFRTPSELGDLVASGHLKNNPTGFALPELAPLMTAHSAAHGAKDLVIGSGNEWTRGLVTAASLTTADGTTTVRLASTSVGGGDVVVTFPGALTPAGPDLYRYAGPAQVATATRFWTAGRRYTAAASVVAVMQRVAPGHYELKLILAHENDASPDVTTVDQSFLTRDLLVVDGFYVPLEAR